MSSATAPDRLAWQANVVAEAARLERKRLLQWIVAWADLSTAWHVESGEDDPRQQTIPSRSNATGACAKPTCVAMTDRRPMSPG
jgi:streptomycin 6-kinase